MTNPSEIRKVAVLISSLEEHAAQALLAKFPPAQAGAVRKASRELRDITPEERRRVLREFMQATGGEEPADEDSGVELDFSLADKLEHGYEDPPAPVALPPQEPPVPPVPFHFLHEADLEQLVRLLSGERPQLIALVMAHLPAEKAAATLGRFHKSQQAEVLTRLAELDEASPEALAEIEQELQELLSEKHRVSQKRAAGFAAVSAILGAAATRDRQSLLASLASGNGNLLAKLGYPTTDEPVAELAGGHAAAIRGALQAQEAKVDQAEREKNARLRYGMTKGNLATTPPPVAKPLRKTLPPPALAEPQPEPAAQVKPEPASAFPVSAEGSTLTFTDLNRLNDDVLARIFARADRQVLRLALSGAEDSLIERMTSCLSRAEARSLRKQLVAIGPIRLSDMEAAQEELAALAQRLCENAAPQTTLLAG